MGIELDAEMAAQAERFCERVIVGDLDTLDLEAELGEDRFDVIVAADVLEHLKDPLKVWRSARLPQAGGLFCRVDAQHRPRQRALGLAGRQI